MSSAPGVQPELVAPDAAAQGPPPGEPPAPPGPWVAPDLSTASGRQPQPGRSARSRVGRLGGLLPRTLTGRLVAGVVALVVLIVVITSSATYALLRPYLTNRLDQQLGPIADANARRIAGCEQASSSFGPEACPFNGPGGYRAPQKQWIALLQGDDQIGLTIQGGTGQDLAVMQLRPSDVERLQRSPADNDTVTTVDGTRLRVAVRAVQGSPLMVATGLSTADEDRTLERLLLLEVGIGAGAVVLASVLTAAGVRFQLRGLHRVTRTARDVSAELSPEGSGLERRVPVEHRTGTEVTELADSVNTMLGAVEAQFAARVASEARMRQFLADASHELRTPLTSIRGYAELARMQRRQGGQLDPEALDRIESEGTRMSRLVDDLLLLARTDQGASPAREVLDVAALADDVVAGARAAHPDRPIDAVVEPGLTVLADPDQLVRVLRNLITNAAVHTAPGGPIRLAARRVVSDAGSAVELAVHDSGPGLPPEEAAHVFERFWRADKARTRARGGSGLGLAIVASIIEAHGGTVSFASTVETGSTVTVRLPA